jgi:hypothetical protein
LLRIGLVISLSPQRYLLISLLSLAVEAAVVALQEAADMVAVALEVIEQVLEPQAVEDLPNQLCLLL